MTSEHAQRVAWQTWSAAAFEQAEREKKPILLSISAVWCHWCHVMDATSYADPAIAEAINANYVPIRVDNDRRPDINARYNQGGWPTTAFLTPEGTLLAGATYMPPEQMRSALQQIATFYRENEASIRERAATMRPDMGEPNAQAHEGLGEPVIARVVARIDEAYDEEFGGFGSAPKFPMTDVLEFLLQEYRVSGKQRLYDMLARSLLAMTSGGTYDHVEGGFFRYSTTRDWSVPHFEKMTEDHAALIRILATLVRTTRNDRFRGTLVSTLSYVRTVLRDARTHLFAGSQDADEAYYAMPIEQRREKKAPYIDWTAYANWSASMGAAFAVAGDALEDERLVVDGETTLDVLHDRMRDDDGLLYHFVEPGGAPQVRGLLTDQSAYLRALIEAHDHGGQPRFLARARDLAGAIEEHFAADGGGFYDHASMEDPLGSLATRDRSLPENAALADSFLRLGVLLNEPRYRAIAERILALYAKTHERAGLFAAPYARALRRYLSPAHCAILVGSPQESAELREAAHALPDALLVTCTIDAAQSEALIARGFDPALHPAAYLCSDSACGAPANTTAQLRDAYEMLVPSLG